LLTRKLVIFGASPCWRLPRVLSHESDSSVSRCGGYLGLGFSQRQCACGLRAARRGSPLTCVTGRSPSTSHTVPAVTRSLAHVLDIELEVCEARGSSSAVVLPLDDESPAMVTVRVQRWSLGRLMGHLLFKLQRTVSPRCSCCGRISGGNDPEFKFVGGGGRSRRRPGGGGGGECGQDTQW
jgi:hypothetical protein